MRRVLIDDAAAAYANLARPVVAPSGEVLAGAGLRLSARAIRSLSERGVAACFIDDAASSGVEISPVIDGQGDDGAFVRALDALMGLAARPLWQARQEPTVQAIQSVHRLRAMPEVVGAAAMQALRVSIETMAERVTGDVPACGLVTDRHPADDLIGHSAAVAALAMRIATAVGFTREDVVVTGFAATLHDIGLLLVPDDIRRTPDAARNAGQQRRWEDHTLLGEALLRPLSAESPSLAVVALQHHEEQAGRGYPHGLTGGNRILRSTDSSAPRIALVSEVVAVADCYERLVSGSPGVRPLSPATARHILAREAGSRLNAEVVARLLDLTPRWPAGVEVILHGGRYEGIRAIVVKPYPDNRDSPLVRVFATPSGAIESFEVDLAASPDLALSAADAVAA